MGGLILVVSDHVSVAAHRAGVAHVALDRKERDEVKCEARVVLDDDVPRDREAVRADLLLGGQFALDEFGAEEYHQGNYTAREIKEMKEMKAMRAVREIWK